MTLACVAAIGLVSDLRAEEATDVTKQSELRRLEGLDAQGVGLGRVAGAVDFVHKPSALTSETIVQMSNELVEKVKAAATIHLKPFERALLVELPATASQPVRGTASIDIVVIGISTGGPQGLEPTRFGDWEKRGKCVDF